MIHIPLAWLLLATALVNGGLAYYTRHYQVTPIMRLDHFLIWITASWALLYRLGIYLININLIFFITDLSNIALGLSIPAFFALVLAYTGHKYRLTRPRIKVLFVLPVIFLSLAFTSARNPVWQYESRMHWLASILIPLGIKSPLYWVYGAYTLVLSLIIMAILVSFFHHRTLHFYNAPILITGMIFQILTSVLYAHDGKLLYRFEWLPLFFLWMGLFYFWAILQGKPSGISALARASLVENISDSMIARNRQEMVMDFDHAAQAQPGVSPESIKTRSGKQAEAEERSPENLMEAFRNAAEVLTSRLDHDDAMDKILDIVGRAAPAECASIALLDDEGWLRHVHFYGFESRDMEKKSLKKKRVSLKAVPIFERAFEIGKPAIISDTKTDPDWVNASCGDWIRSYAVMPMRIKEKVIGFLNLGSGAPGFYTSGRIHNLSAFADLAAKAIENARLYTAAEFETRERRQVEERLRQLSQAVEQSPVSIVITDTNGNIEYVNPRFTELTGYRPEEAIGKNPRILKSGKTPPETYPVLWKTLLAGEEWRGEFINRKKSGEEFFESAVIAPIIDDQGIITHFLAVKENITERKKADNEILLLQEQLREQAIRDPLTGLFNRRYLDEILDRELARADREGYSISFVMIDIDHFKQINDSFGHHAGDAVLQMLASLLLSQTRIGDILCRYGGEEFLAILPNVSAKRAFQITERWRVSFMRSSLPEQYRRVKATISCGICEYPGLANMGNEMIALADWAMYQAKANGRNQVVVYKA